jgi:hypothetical protein
MKAARQAKLEAQLAATETELLALLRDSLPHTAEHGDMLFYNSRFRPEYVQDHQTSERSEALISLASESTEIREQIGAPIAGSPGQLYISACSESADTSNGNRRGPRQLAAWLLSELGPN